MKVRGFPNHEPDQVIKARMQFLSALVDERHRQIDKWGQNNTDRFVPAFAQILGEEFGEVCRALCEHDEENLEVELVQVAAVCCRMYETLRERRERAAELAAAARPEGGSR